MWVLVFAVVAAHTTEVTIDGTTDVITENEAIYVPVGAVHRIANEGRLPLELIEVRAGAYIGEDDIIRLEDVYSRI